MNETDTAQVGAHPETDYRVEVTLSPTDDFTALRAATDIIPGTLLIEDPEFPELHVPVTAESRGLALAEVVEALWDAVGPFLTACVVAGDEDEG